MKPDQSTLCERLLAQEPLSPKSQLRLEGELRTMFIRQLNTPRRIVFAAIALGALISGIVCGALALTEPELPMLARCALGTGTLFGFAWCFVTIRIAWQGSLDLKLDGGRIAAMVWGFTVLMMVFFLMVGMSSQDRVMGVMMIVYGLAFLIAAGVYWLTYRIREAELTVREKLLQLELRMAEMVEKS